MVVLGAIFTHTPIYQTLTDLIWIGLDKALDDTSIRATARVLHALGRGISKLREFYQHLPSTQLDERQGFFPSITSYYDDVQRARVRFNYVKPLEALASSPACVTFLARTVEDSPRDIVVKFVKQYGRAAHMFLARHNLAPQLFYFGAIDDRAGSPSYSGLSMVVMEYLKGDTLAAHLYDPRKTNAMSLEQLSTSLHRVIGLLHDEGFVFGDLRTPNIMAQGESIKLIDFDWAGRAGEAKYPLFLSSEIGWAPDAAGDGFITKKHDLYMVEAILTAWRRHRGGRGHSE
jgi:serine/threonine protein kinase